MFKSVTAALLIWILSLPSFALAETKPGEIVQTAANQLIQELTSNQKKYSETPALLNEMVEEVLLPIVDSERMAKLALGKHWQNASKEQRQQFVDNFRKLLVKTYSGAFSAFSGQEVSFQKTRFNKSGDKALVRSEIAQPGNAPIVVDYKLYKKKDGSWKMYDAVVSGLALVKSYRAQFSEQIQRDGLEQTLTTLEKEVNSVAKID